MNVNGHIDESLGLWYVPLSISLSITDISLVNTLHRVDPHVYTFHPLNHTRSSMIQSPLFPSIYFTSWIISPFFPLSTAHPNTTSELPSPFTIHQFSTTVLSARECLYDFHHYRLCPPWFTSFCSPFHSPSHIEAQSLINLNINVISTHLRKVGRNYMGGFEFMFDPIAKSWAPQGGGTHIQSVIFDKISKSDGRTQIVLWITLWVSIHIRQIQY